MLGRYKLMVPSVTAFSFVDLSTNGPSTTVSLAIVHLLLKEDF